LTGCGKKHFAPPPEPNAPSNLTAIAVSYKQIHLSWQDNCNDEDYFRVLCPTMWGIQHQTIATLPPNTTSFDHCNLQPMTEYEYYVCVHGGEEHTCSERAYATTPCPVEIRWCSLAFVPNTRYKISGEIQSYAAESCLVGLIGCLYKQETGECVICQEDKFYLSAYTFAKTFEIWIMEGGYAEPKCTPNCDFTVEITDVEIEY